MSERDPVQAIRDQYPGAADQGAEELIRALSKELVMISPRTIVFVGDDNRMVKLVRGESGNWIRSAAVKFDSTTEEKLLARGLRNRKAGNTTSNS